MPDAPASSAAPPAAPAAPPAAPAGQSLIPPAAPPGAPPPGSQPPTAEQRPEYIPEKFWREGKPDVENLGKSYVALEQRQGKLANSVLVPDEKSTPEEIAAYVAKVGALPSVEDYAKIKPENLPPGVDWNDDLAKPLYEIAHKHKIPAAAVKEYLAMRALQEGARVDAVNAELSKQLEAGTKTLQRDWGSNYGSNIERVKQAAQMVGINPSTAPGFRDPETVKAFLRLSEKLSDDTWRTGTANLQTPGGSAKDIMTNSANPLYQKYQAGDPDTVAHVRSLLAKVAA